MILFKMIIGIALALLLLPSISIIQDVGTIIITDDTPLTERILLIPVLFILVIIGVLLYFQGINFIIS